MDIPFADSPEWRPTRAGERIPEGTIVRGIDAAGLPAWGYAVYFAGELCFLPADLQIPIGRKGVPFRQPRKEGN